MRKSLHHLIFVAMFLGALVGILLDQFAPRDAGWLADVNQWTTFFGRTVFVGILKMIIAPLILISIVAGVTSIPSFKEAGRIGGRTVIYYVATTTIAVTIGLILVLLIQPGQQGGADSIREKREAELAKREIEFASARLDKVTSKEEATAHIAENELAYKLWLLEREDAELDERAKAKYAKMMAKRERTSFDLFVDDIVKPLLMNPFESLSRSPTNSLGIIFFSLLFGLACVACGERAAPVVGFFQGAYAVILKLTNWIMSLSPFAVFCLIISIILEYGLGVFESLGWYSGTVIGAIALHVLVLLTIVAVFGRVSPLQFLRGIREAWAIAFSTRSSAATLPVTVRCVTTNLGVRKKVANFTLPVGATINMDGTALYEGVAVIFLLQVFGGLADVPIQLGGEVTLLVFVTAVLASVGAAAVPDAGLITMVLVANAVGLPIYYIPFIFAVDAFLDMFRTSTNIMGDAVGAVVVDRMTGGNPGHVAAPPPENAPV